MDGSKKRGCSAFRMLINNEKSMSNILILFNNLEMRRLYVLFKLLTSVLQLTVFLWFIYYINHHLIIPLNRLFSLPRILIWLKLKLWQWCLARAVFWSLCVCVILMQLFLCCWILYFYNSIEFIAISYNGNFEGWPT